MDKIEYVRGDDRPHTYGIETAVAENGPWYLLLRVHDKIWNDKHWPFETRWGASHYLWLLDGTFFAGHHGDPLPEWGRSNFF